ncbi:hypothetical protein HJA90_10415 [Rhizobium bangladeshense]|uniref:GcrA family cell cycle regulator n=1 Tax=Rhizobium bangladeshense TaxID=1138189 RepID=UPI001C83CA59|nr:GcrA family cell cycle regulator [Rhizobium bangladeshense]MBX4883995.1 hypothetical protein [Rhizobium bangladeshense]
MSTYPDWLTLSKEQRIEAIKPLVAKGFSASIIANRFRNVTRNAIIGYLTRYNIKRGKSQAKPAGTSKTSAKAATTTTTARRAHEEPDHQSAIPYKAKTESSVKAVPDMIALEPIAKSRAFDPIDGVPPVRLENLGARQCHWPVNGLHGHEPIFCGARASNLYCTSHERLAYSPHGH